MNDLQETIIPKSEPMETLLSVMGKGFLEVWMKVWINKDDKLEVALHSTHAFTEREEFAFVLMDIATSLMDDDWKTVAEMFLDCRSCFDYMREHDVLPLVCSDCGRGVEDYVGKKTDR